MQSIGLFTLLCVLLSGQFINARLRSTTIRRKLLNPSVEFGTDLAPSHKIIDTSIVSSGGDPSTDPASDTDGETAVTEDASEDGGNTQGEVTTSETGSSNENKDTNTVGGDDTTNTGANPSTESVQGSGSTQPLSVGAGIGIGVGATVLIGAVAYFVGRRQKNKVDAEEGLDKDMAEVEPNDTPPNSDPTIGDNNAEEEKSEDDEESG